MKINSNRRQIWPSRSEPQLSARCQTAGITLLLLLNLHPTTSRPPLPLPLRPARPPETEGRGAGGSRETLTGRGRRENEKGKVPSPLCSGFNSRLAIGCSPCTDRGRGTDVRVWGGVRSRPRHRSAYVCLSHGCSASSRD
jgi:hypothetical protein